MVQPISIHKSITHPNDKEMNFFETIFSFVFGDGDPNQGIEEKRWKLIGQYIASKGGVVTAAELTPYLDLGTDENMADDSNYILPVLLKFDGQPVVDGEGNILYQFPLLQRTATADYVAGVHEKLFTEAKWEFSKITDKLERALIIGLGGVNLGLVVILGNLLKNETVAPNRSISFVSSIYPLLQIYAASFFVIPLGRWFFIWKTNAEIEKRNRAREECARALESPDLSLRMKLQSARDMSQRTFVGQDRIFYTTERDLFEQDYHRKEWDQQFQGIEKSD